MCRDAAMLPRRAPSSLDLPRRTAAPRRRSSGAAHHSVPERWTRTALATLGLARCLARGAPERQLRGGLRACAEGQEGMEDILGDGSVLKSVVEEGDDPPVYPIFGDECITHFVGTLPDGKIFNDTMKRDQPFKFALGAQEVLEGFDEGVATMRQGERAVLHLTPEVAYGALGARDEAGWQVPPDTAVTFDVRLLQVIKTATPGSDGQSEASRGFGRQDVGKGGQDIAYRWERKGAEVLVIVPVQENIQLKDVSHSFQEKKVVLQVQQEVILEGIPGCDLEPEECYWEFETDPAGRKCVFVHLQKKGSLTARWPETLLK